MVEGVVLNRSKRSSRTRKEKAQTRTHVPDLLGTHANQMRHVCDHHIKSNLSSLVGLLETTIFLIFQLFNKPENDYTVLLRTMIYFRDMLFLHLPFIFFLSNLLLNL
jgi:hypothetical protein